MGENLRELIAKIEIMEKEHKEQIDMLHNEIRGLKERITKLEV